MKKQKKVRLDFRPHFFRAFFFIGLYCTITKYVVHNASLLRDEAPPPGLKYYPSLNYWVTNEMVYIAPLLYTIMVFVSCRIMQRLDSLEKYVKVVQPFYNVIQILLCSYMTYGLLPCIGIWNGELPFSLNMQYSKRVEYFVWIHYMSKFLDWTDTLFMVFKKRFNQVSFLHVFHHATIGLQWGFLLNDGVAGGTSGFGAWMNSLTHVIMYTHYLVTSFGWKNPFKKYITRWQLFQFLTCLVHITLIIVSPYDTVLPKIYAIAPFMYACFMLLLFGFYMSWVPSWLTGSYPEDNKKHK